MRTEGTIEEKVEVENATETTEQNSTVAETTAVPSTVVNTEALDKKSLAILNQLIAENDVNKTKDLTYLFNDNQNKKTMVRVNKMNELLDLLTDKLMDRAINKPDEITTTELMQGIKSVSELIERGQKQVSGANEVPLIQINQQTNEVNVGDNKPALNRDSREKVKNAVLSLLNGLVVQEPTEEDIIDVSTNEENK